MVLLGGAAADAHGADEPAVAVDGQPARDEQQGTVEGVSCRSGRIRERRVVSWIARRTREATRSVVE
ncbi:hypothetical protein ADK98_03845 [Streptomyces sp. H036]|nr:hypothetical protein ADK98_03845 [Streptomyces sp. H036]